MRSNNAVRAFHEPQGAAGILPAEESEKSPASGTFLNRLLRASFAFLLFDFTLGITFAEA
jgi:hypothetical protein